MADRSQPHSPAETATRPPERSVPTDASPPTGADRIRPGVKALVATTDTVLLVREHHTDGTPFWTLPGGGVHPGESPRRALRREVAEELRCRCLVDRPVTAVPYVHRSNAAVSVYTVYACKLLTAPDPSDAAGVTALRWARPDALPPRTLPQVRTAVRRYVER